MRLQGNVGLVAPMHAIDDVIALPQQAADPFGQIAIVFRQQDTHGTRFASNEVVGTTLACNSILYQRCKEGPLGPRLSAGFFLNRRDIKSRLKAGSAGFYRLCLKKSRSKACAFVASMPE